MREVLRCRFVVLTFAVCSVAHAGPVTFYYSGEITRVHDPDGLLGGQIMVGDTFAGQFGVDSEAVDSDGDPRRGIYNAAVGLSSGRLADVPYNQVSSSIGSLWTEDGLILPTIDFLQFQSEIVLLMHRLDLVASLVDNDGLLLSNDGIPSALDFNAVDSVVFTIGDKTESIQVSVDGHITSFVPEPNTLILVATVLTVLCCARRRSLLGNKWHGLARHPGLHRHTFPFVTASEWK